jgi:HD superfamily phosphodiesterase
MEHLKAKIMRQLVEFFGNDDRRIDHAIDVLINCEFIKDTLDEPCDDDVLTACALLHDVGIKPVEEKHGHNTGQMQEEYGPDIARELLSRIGFPAYKMEKVMQIIANHHSISKYDYIELSILKEADRIVNMGEY